MNNRRLKIKPAKTAKIAKTAKTEKAAKTNIKINNKHQTKKERKNLKILSMINKKLKLKTIKIRL
jgi:hypothetical protein